MGSLQLQYSQVRGGDIVISARPVLRQYSQRPSLMLTMSWRAAIERAVGCSWALLWPETPKSSNLGAGSINCLAKIAEIGGVVRGASISIFACY